MSNDIRNVIDVDIRTRLDDFALEVCFEAQANDVIAVVGPNGAGKTTLLRVLAGLAVADGHLRVDDEDVLRRPVARRGVGWVPQEGALFPHLSALDNVAFGIGHRRGRAAAHDWLARLGIAELADRRPSELSGGQAQKVALARALVRNPRLLLLDEPLAALDIEARVDVRRALRQHLTAFAGVVLLVTHDPVDVTTLAGRIVALEAGRVVQTGSPVDIARAPRSPWLAALMGSNAFRGRIHAGGVDLVDGGRFVSADLTGPDGADALAVVPAHAVVIDRARPTGSARNAWPIVVTQLAMIGPRVRLHADGAPPVVAEITPAAVAELGLHEGVDAWASVKATEVTVVVL
jgi:molybdopterin-binding protein